jgi:hypothetical protein
LLPHKQVLKVYGFSFNFIFWGKLIMSVTSLPLPWDVGIATSVYRQSLKPREKEGRA